MLAALTLRGSQLWPWSVGALAAVVGAIVLLYWPQVKGLGRPWHWVLPTLRGLALGALAASMVRPVISRSKTVEEQGAVVVLMDKSMSMGVMDHAMGENEGDRKRVLGQLLAVADGLGRLPEGVRSKAVAGVSEDLKRLDSLAEDIARARREVEYARLSGRQMQQAQGRLEEAIRAFVASAKSAEQTAKAIGSKPAVVEQLARLARSPRPERREEWIRDLRKSIEQTRAPTEESQAGIDEELYQSNQPVRWEVDGLSRMSRLGLCWEMVGGGAKSLLGRLDKKTAVVGFAIGDGLMPIPLRVGEEGRELAVEAEGTTSDLSGGLRRVLGRLGGRPLQAVVLFSDGRQVGASGVIPAGLLPSGVPIFTVYAAAGQVRDLAIEHVESPRAVYMGEWLTVKVVARTVGIDGRKIAGQAELAMDGTEAVRTPLRLRDGHLEAELRTKLDKPGMQRVVINVPVQSGEATATNNRVERWVKVVSQRQRVLLVSSSAGWDYRYMRNALLRSPLVQLREALVVPGYSGLAMMRGEVLQQDVVILNDIAKECLSLEQWDGIRELVSRRGGSVILIAGVGHLQQEHAGHVLSELQPYPASVRPSWRIWPGEAAHYHVAAADGAEDLTGLWMDDDVEVGRRRWDELPGFYRFLFLPVPELKANAKVLLMERESRGAILTESRVGTGRVFFLGMNETWRWRQWVGERDQDRFWVRLVRHAGEAPYAVSSGPLLVDVDPVAAEVGEAIHVRARLISRLSEWPPPTAVDMAVVQGGQTVKLGSLEPAGNVSDGRYAAVLNDLAIGEYELRVAAPAGDQVEHEVVLPIRVEKSGEEEMRNVAGDREFLARLAEASGGKCLNIEQVGMLPELLQEAVMRQPRMSEVHLWDSYYLFIFVLSCLAAEWAVRKRVGLA